MNKFQREQSGLLVKDVCFTLKTTHYCEPKDCEPQDCQTGGTSAWAVKSFSYLNCPTWFYFTTVEFLCCSKLLCCGFYAAETAAVFTDGKWEK